MVRQLVSRAELEGHLDLKGKELDALMTAKSWSPGRLTDLVV